MNTKVTVLIAIVIIAVIALGAWYIYGKKFAAPVAPAAEQGLGSDIYGQVAPNAAENLPETNPFKQEANPFKDVQTNPFGQ